MSDKDLMTYGIVGAIVFIGLYLFGMANGKPGIQLTGADTKANMGQSSCGCGG
jgi:hypothetical protein